MHASIKLNPSQHQIITKFKTDMKAVYEKHDYMANILSRLDFLTFLTFHSSYKISSKEISTICDLLIDKSQNPDDKESAVIWLKILVTNHHRLVHILNTQDKNVVKIIQKRLK